MERVVTQQLHSKKILDKKLNEINANQRLSQARLDRELQELGLDLTKIKRSSVALDDLHDLSPRPSGRRGSLPHLADDITSLKPLGASHSPRSRRRFSIPGIPVTPRNVHIASYSSSVADNQKTTRRGSIPNNSTSIGDQTHTIKSSRNSNGSPSAGRKKMSQEHNEPANSARVSNQNLPKIDDSIKDVNSCSVKRKNTTAIFVHQEDGVVNIDNQIVEGESSHLMGATKGRRTRRSSEPAISVQFLHIGHVNGCDVLSHSNGDMGEIRQAIQQHLPSNMVAEENEETDDRDGNGSDEATQSQLEEMGATSKTVQKAAKTMKKKSIASEKDQSKPMAGSGNIKNVVPPGQGYSRQRRKSEGDILRFAQIWTRQQEDLRNGRIKSLGPKNGYSFGVRDSSDDVWDSVRKCRYIRGYDPPEMIEPSDPNEYVFGHKSNEANVRH